MYMYGDIHDHLQRNDVPGKCKYLRKHVCKQRQSPPEIFQNEY